jgi:hypothetical protein
VLKETFPLSAALNTAVSDPETELFAAVIAAVFAQVVLVVYLVTLVPFAAILPPVLSLAPAARYGLVPTDAVLRLSVLELKFPGAAGLVEIVIDLDLLFVWNNVPGVP